jgi:hypothetical protein
MEDDFFILYSFVLKSFRFLKDPCMLKVFLMKNIMYFNVFGSLINIQLDNLMKKESSFSLSYAHTHFTHMYSISVSFSLSFS